MTEAKWLNSADPKEMLDFLAGKVPRKVKPSLVALLQRCGERKLKLFAVACCRRLPVTAHSPSVQQLADRVERLADNLAKFGNCLEDHMYDDPNDVGAVDGAHTIEGMLICSVPEVFPFYSPEEKYQALLEYLEKLQCLSGQVMQEERVAQVHLLRDLIGNPFRPSSADPSWITNDVVALAQALYEERAFDRLPILADALEEAGCDNQDILSHCRQLGDHVRGCWAVDLLLGKT